MWRSIGPRNINGRVRALAIHPRNGNVVYAGSGNGGVWVTDSGGLSWSPLIQTLRDVSSLAIGALAVHLTDPTSPLGRVTVYAGTGEPESHFPYPGAGVLKSTDSGHHWRRTGDLPTASGTPPKGIAAIVVDPTSPQTVYVAAYDGGLFKSTNGGNTWRLLRGGDYRSLVMDPSNPQILCAGQNSTGVFKKIGRAHV